MKKLKLSIILILTVTMFGALAACNFINDLIDASYTVNFYDGKELVKTETFKDKNATVTAPTVSEKPGYTFVKWEDLSGREFASDYKLRYRTNFYAVWQTVEYSITYSLHGGVNDARNPSKYTVEDEITLKEATSDGYDFDGWSISAEDTPIKSRKIEKGTTGDLTFIANFSFRSVTLTFDTQGGSEVAPISAKAGEAITAPEAPTKRYCTFTGWYKDKDCTEEFTFDVMPERNLTVYAGWFSDQYYRLYYSATEGAAIESETASGGKVLAGETVNVVAPTFADGLVFNYWTQDGEIYSYDNALIFDMPKKDLTLAAVYSEVETVFYDANSEEGLTVTATSAIEKLDGVRITPDDYVLSGNAATINAAFLKKLSDGYYPMLLTAGEGSKYLTLKIFRSASTIYNVKLDYDMNYPEVTLVIDGKAGEEFEYSLDASIFKKAQTGTIIEGYDKSTSHNVTVRNKNDKTEQFVVNKAGYTETEREFIENYFEYGGQKYDNFIEDYDEFAACVEYIVYVYAPLNRDNASEEYPGGEAFYEFCCSEDFYKNFAKKTGGEISSSDEIITDSEVIGRYFASVIISGGVPYSPRYAYSIGADHIARLTIYFKTDSPNEVVSLQEKGETLNVQNLLKTSSRTNDFNDFKINSFERSQVIRTLYELEDLPFGVKPVFETTSGQAYETYQKALEILRAYVDDEMSDFEKVAAIFDYIALTVTYDDAVAAAAYASEELRYSVGKYTAFTSYGALIKNVAVCDGIASAFSMLCKIEGIECTEVAGKGNGGGHAWNKVKISGLWYVVDATWSHLSTEDGKYVYHKSFLVDEIESNALSHEENASLAEAARFTENVALSPLNYFNVAFYGDDYTAESNEEFVELLESRIPGGVGAAELKVSGISIDEAIDFATEYFRKSFGYFTLNEEKGLVLIAMKE